MERSNTGKVLWPDDGVTKGEFLDYLDAVGDRIVRFISGRPLTVVRAPDGIGKQIFYQKNAPKHTPEWIRTVTFYAPSAKRDVRYYVCDSKDALLWLGNQAAIELHVVSARLPALDRPDVLIVDLDPPDGRFDLAVEAARVIDGLLHGDGLRAAVKTTGGKGLHLVVPLENAHDHETVMRYAQDVADRAIAFAPALLTQEYKKADRAGRLFVDIGRNTPGATMASVYTPRVRPGAPVSFPVRSEDLEAADPAAFTIRTAPRLLGSAGVREWDEILARPQRLPDA